MFSMHHIHSSDNYTAHNPPCFKDLFQPLGLLELGDNKMCLCELRFGGTV